MTAEVSFNHTHELWSIEQANVTHPLILNILHRIFEKSITQLCIKDYTPIQCITWLGRLKNEDDWAKCMQSISPYFVKKEQHYCGYASLDCLGYINHFFISPHYIRQGAGSYLMNYLIDLARQQSIERISAQVSLTAKDFFTYHGFIVEYQQTTLINHVEFTNFVMSLRLK